MAAATHRGAVRQFSAFARPQGDAACGIAGPLVEIHERRARVLEKVRVLSHAEAAQLHFELGEALRAFLLAEALAADVASASSSAAVGQQEGPRAYTGPYPIRGKTLADCPPREEAPALSGDDRR